MQRYRSFKRVLKEKKKKMRKEDFNFLKTRISSKCLKKETIDLLNK